MKNRIVAIVLAVVLCVGLLPILAENKIDVKNISDSELVMLLKIVQQEIVDRKIEKTATIYQGRYIVGVDIPAGRYLIQCKNNDTLWTEVDVLYENGKKRRGRFTTYKDDVRKMELTLEEGDVVRIDGSGTITLTVSTGIKFE